MPPLSLSDPSIFASPHVFPPSSDPPLVLVLFISVDPLFSLSFDLDNLIATRVKNNKVAYIAQICRKRRQIITAENQQRENGVSNMHIATHDKRREVRGKRRRTPMG
jgi:hypothetical protein